MAFQLLFVIWWSRVTHPSYRRLAFFRTFKPDYVVISVGQGNRYDHPDRDTMDLFSNPKSDLQPKVYRTDHNGNITVESDGKTISVTSSR